MSSQHRGGPVGASQSSVHGGGFGVWIWWFSSDFGEPDRPLPELRIGPNFKTLFFPAPWVPGECSGAPGARLGGLRAHVHGGTFFSFRHPKNRPRPHRYTHPRQQTRFFPARSTPGPHSETVGGGVGAVQSTRHGELFPYAPGSKSSVSKHWINPF